VPMACSSGPLAEWYFSSVNWPFDLDFASVARAFGGLLTSLLVSEHSFCRSPTSSPRSVRLSAVAWIVLGPADS
jgi:hypothetical protein